MKGIMRRLCIVFVALLALAAPALALSDAEYKKMMKDPAFAAADKKLNQVWAGLKKSMPKDAFEALRKEQSAWAAKGRDKEASESIRAGLSQVEAYAAATNRRAEYLSSLAEQRKPQPNAKSQKAKPADKAGVKIDAANFPDENFRRWVKEEVAGGRNVLTDAQIAAVENMDLNSQGISSLKGLEFFTALKTLECSENKLTKLDLSRNPALDMLFCNDNMLTELDLSHNPLLEELHCYNNKLTKLALPHAPALTKLHCYDNELTKLDLPHAPALEMLTCSGNGLTELDLAHVPALDWLDCDDNKLTKLDLTHNPALGGLFCRKNPIRELDLSKNVELSQAHFPAAATVTLPNGDKIATDDFQLRRTADGQYRLVLSKYAGKIKAVTVYDMEAEKNVEAASSGGNYTFTPREGHCTISYRLGERNGEDWLLSLPLDVTKDLSSVPLAESE